MATTELEKPEGATGPAAATRPSHPRQGHNDNQPRSTISASVLSGFFELVLERGGDARKLLVASGLPPEVSRRLGAKIDLRKYAGLLENAAFALNCPDFGMRLAELQNGIAMMGPIERLLKFAPTMGDSLAYSAQHMHLHSCGIQLSLSKESAFGQPFLRFELIAPNIPFRRQLMEELIGLAYYGNVRRTGGAARPREIWFSHQNLASPHAYSRRFRSTVRFAQPFNAIFYEEADLKAPILTSTPLNYEREIQQVSQLCPYQSALFNDVKGAINWAMFNSSCSRQAVAAELGVHPRTLHRRLSEIGVTFEVLKDEVRRDLASHYLAQSNVEIFDVAGRLGYAEVSAFSRACRRWFGVSPRGLRRRLASQGPRIENVDGARH